MRKLALGGVDCCMIRGGESVLSVSSVEEEAAVKMRHRMAARTQMKVMDAAEIIID